MSVKTVIVSPFPYYSGTMYAPEPTGGAGAVGIWYAYFEPTGLANDGQNQIVSLSGIGASGNVDLFESVGDGVKLKSTAIIQATAWGIVMDAIAEHKWLGIQLDKQGTLLIRAHTVFNQKAANITYGGVLAPDDILRIVGCNETSSVDQIVEGWVSVIASPI